MTLMTQDFVHSKLCWIDPHMFTTAWLVNINNKSYIIIYMMYNFLSYYKIKNSNTGNNNLLFKSASESAVTDHFSLS